MTEKLLTSEQYARWSNDTGLRELRQILYWRWDPLGVSDDFPVTEDEYDSYAQMLLGRLRQGLDEDGIADYLLAVEKESMGQRLSSNEHLRHVADLVLGWYEQSMLSWLDRQGLGGHKPSRSR
jgi:hypothetical protein